MTQSYKDKEKEVIGFLDIKDVMAEKPAKILDWPSLEHGFSGEAFVKNKSRRISWSNQGELVAESRDVLQVLGEKYEESQEKNEHEQTRALISEKLDELAKKDDLLKAKDEIIENVKKESNEIQKELMAHVKELQVNLSRFLPYKRTFKASFYFTCIFSASIIADVFSVKIIEPFWAYLGLIISLAFMLMSYSMFLDWQKNSHERNT